VKAPHPTLAPFVTRKGRTVIMTAPVMGADGVQCFDYELTADQVGSLLVALSAAACDMLRPHAIRLPPDIDIMSHDNSG